MEREEDVQPHAFLASALEGMCDQLHNAAACAAV